MSEKAMIADIQRASLHDGPGIRTTVFFKGCPLHCAWCHNPECIDPKPQMMYYPDKCIGCGQCRNGCFSGARVLCGKEMTVQEVFDEIRQDMDYYGSEGGVTFSGGEPLLWRAFLREILPLLRAAGISAAVETSLIFYDEELFRQFDVIMADLKIWDSSVHKAYTGVPNEGIIENFKKLNGLGIPVIARTPVIPGVQQEIGQTSAFLKTLENVEKYELLPYHPLGESKRKALGMELNRFVVPDSGYMKSLYGFSFDRKKQEKKI